MWVVLFMGLAGCTPTSLETDDTAADPAVTPLRPEPRVAEDIRLVVRAVLEGELQSLTTLDLEIEGEVDLAGTEPRCAAIHCMTFARADGFFTGLYRGEQFSVDLDAIPEGEDALAGFVYTTDFHSGHSTMGSVRLDLGGHSFFTDDEGRFALSGLPLGELFLTPPSEFYSSPRLTNTTGMDYYDVSLVFQNT